MCVVSFVQDSFTPVFEPFKLRDDGTWVMPGTNPFSVRTWPVDGLTLEQVREEIDRYFTQISKAETIDRLTNQPDCEDPEKAKLREQVERLERVVDALLAERAK